MSARPMTGDEMSDHIFTLGDRIVGYKIRATTKFGVKWLGAGRLFEKERQATYHISPSAARTAARTYINSHDSEHLFELLREPGGEVVEVVKRWGKRLKVTINVEHLPSGDYRVWSHEAGCDTITKDFVAEAEAIARYWGEKVEHICA